MSFDLFNIKSNNDYLETVTITQGLEYKQKQNRLIDLAKQKNVYFNNSNVSQPDSLIESFVEGIDGESNTGGTVATLPPKISSAIKNTALDTITNQIITSSDPAVQAQQQNYMNLLNQYVSVKEKRDANSSTFHKDTEDYINATSPDNPFRNKFIVTQQGSPGGGQVYYVTNKGSLRHIPNMDVWNSISGKNGCPTINSYTQLQSALVPSTSGKFLYTQAPDSKAVFSKDDLFENTDMGMYETCGTEGKNVYVSSAWNNPKADYNGTFFTWDSYRPYENYHDGQKYDKASCMSQAVNDGVSNFALTNYNKDTGLADCVTLSVPSVTQGVDQTNRTCSSNKYLWRGRTWDYPDGQVYGNENSVAAYTTPNEKIGSVHFVGVFNDNAWRALPLVNSGRYLSNYWGGDYNHTYESCLKYAAGGNRDGPEGSPVYYKYFGLQDGHNGGRQTQCGVSNVDNPTQGYGRYGQIRPRQAGIKNKDGLMYGGGWQNAMYDTQTGSFLGIYGDSGDRAAKHLAGGRDNNNTNNYFRCRKYAMDNNYKYFGLQYINTDNGTAECWTTNDDSPTTGYKKYGRQDNIPGSFQGIGASDPNLNPVGYTNPVYGGGWQNAVYAVDYQNGNPDSYLGCYNYNQNSPQATMTNLADYTNAKDCIARAQAGGYKYYALGSPNEYGNAACLGTNNPTDFQQNGNYSTVLTNKNGDKVGNYNYFSTYTLNTGTPFLPTNNLIGTAGFVESSGTLSRY